MRNHIRYKNRASAYNLTLMINIKMTDIFRKTLLQLSDLSSGMNRFCVVFPVQIRNQDFIPEQIKFQFFLNYQTILFAAADAFPACFCNLKRLSQIKNRKTVPSQQFCIGQEQGILYFFRKITG